MIGKTVPSVFEVLAGLQQGFARDAAHVGAGAAQGGPAFGVFPFVDARSTETQLRGADGGHITTRATADDDDIKVFAHCLISNVKVQMSKSKRAGSSSASFIATKPSTASRPSMMRWS